MLRARLEKLREQKGPKIKGNKVVGGTPEKRLQVCMLGSARAVQDRQARELL